MSLSCSRITRLLVLLLIAVGELALLCYLIWIGHLYIEYFTYLNKTVFMIVLWIIIISNIDYLAFQWIVTIFLPFLVATGLTVGIAVTIIAYCRPILIIQDMEETGFDPDGVALVHTGDWLFHQLPFFEAVIIAFCLYKETSCALRYQIDRQITNKFWRGLFIVFVCWLHCIFTFVYCLIAPFDHVYFLGPPAVAAIPAGIIAAITIGIGGVVYCMFFCVVGHNPNPKHAGETLLVSASAYMRRQIRDHIVGRSGIAESATDVANGGTSCAKEGGQYIRTIDRSVAQH